MFLTMQFLPNKSTFCAIAMLLMLTACGGGSGGDGGGGGSSDTTMIMVPDTPINISAVSTNDKISINWDQSDKAITYRLYWNTIGNLTKSDEFFMVSNLSYEHTLLISGTRYFYGVSAVNEDGESDISPVVSPISIPSSTISAYYPFSGNANDGSGNGNSGNVLGAVLTSDRFEIADNAYEFDGIDDYITFGSVTPLANHSISVWIRPQSQTQNGTIVGHEAGPAEACNKGFRVIITPERKPSYLLDLAGCGVSETIVKDDNTVLDVNAWFHLVATYDGDAAKLYVDRVLVDQQVGASFDASSWVALGATTFFNGQQVHFKGSIDDVRIFFTALSELEIQALFDEGRVITP